MGLVSRGAKQDVAASHAEPKCKREDISSESLLSGAGA